MKKKAREVRERGGVRVYLDASLSLADAASIADVPLWFARRQVARVQVFSLVDRVSPVAPQALREMWTAYLGRRERGG